MYKVDVSATSFTERLRAATADAHRRAESTPFVHAVRAGALPDHAHVQATAALCPAYEALEDGLRSDPRLAPLLPSWLARAPALRADLRALRAEGVRTDAGVAYAAHLRALSAGPARSIGLLGHAYARHLGDLSGGRILARLLGAQLSPAASRGLAFYAFGDDAPPPGPAKAAWKEIVDAMTLSDAEEAIVVEEAQASFAFSTLILLEAMPAVEEVAA